jgi:hypothetical protein
MLLGYFHAALYLSASGDLSPKIILLLFKDRWVERYNAVEYAGTNGLLKNEPPAFPAPGLPEVDGCQRSVFLTRAM